jgi:hypothetical protein
MQSRRLLAATALVLVAGQASLARAETPKEQAETLVRDGIKDARAQRFKDAADKFERAFKLLPTAEVLHNLARAHEELGNLPLAHSYFTQALRMNAEYTFAKDGRARIPKLETKLGKTHGLVRVKSTPSEVEITLEAAGQPAEGHLVSPVERWIPAGKLKVTGRKAEFQPGHQMLEVVAGLDLDVKVVLRPETKEGFLDVSANAPDAIVFIAGKEVGPAPLRGITYPTGSYPLAIRATGYKDFETQIIVQVDQVTNVAAAMVKIEDTNTGPPDHGNTTLAATAEPAEDGTPLAIAGGVLAGVGVAAAGAGLGIYLWVKADADAFNKGTLHPEWVQGVPHTQEGDAFAASINRRQYAALGLAIGGGALVGVGLGLLIHGVTTGGAEPAQEPAATWVPSIAPLPGGMRLGATVTW